MKPKQRIKIIRLRTFCFDSLPTITLAEIIESIDFELKKHDKVVLDATGLGSIMIFAETLGYALNRIYPQYRNRIELVNAGALSILCFEKSIKN